MAIRTMAEVERDCIQQAMVELAGNKSAAARALGFDRRTLYRKIQADPELREAWGSTLGSSRAMLEARIRVLQERLAAVGHE